MCSGRLQVVPENQLIQPLRHFATAQPEKIAVVSLETAGRQSLTYAQLDRHLQRVGAAISDKTTVGARAIVLLPQGLPFIGGFFGCWYAGVTPVPVPPLEIARAAAALPRLSAIVRASKPSVVVSTRSVREAILAVPSLADDLQLVPWVDVDTRNDAERIRAATLEVALLQFTSGSTGVPKGVVISEENLLTNLEMLREYFAFRSDSTMVSWLPQFHDMGLIASMCLALLSGGTFISLSPVDFLKRPRLWLELISEYRGTHTGSPNFGFELCVKKVGTTDLAGLDLRSLECAFNGSEPVRWATLDRFARHFAAAGFAPRATTPCFGMAEATVFVSCKSHRTSDPAPLEGSRRALSRGRWEPFTEPEDRTELVSCGPSPTNSVIAIVDAAGASVPAGVIGEVWVCGPHIGQGYFEAPSDAFHARLASHPGKAFLATGDLGMLVAGELYITGRLKDLIIVRGRNLYPSDIEVAVTQQVLSVRPGCVAAVSVDVDGVEGLAVIAEVERRHHERRVQPPTAAIANLRKAERRAEEVPALRSVGEVQFADIERDIRTLVSKAFGVVPDPIVLIRAGSLPKTSSGKINRLEVRRQLREGELLRVEAVA